MAIMIFLIPTFIVIVDLLSKVVVQCQEYPSRHDLMEQESFGVWRGWLKKEFHSTKAFIITKKRMSKLLSVGPKLECALGRFFLTVSKYDNVKMFSTKDNNRILVYESLIENLVLIDERTQSSYKNVLKMLIKVQSIRYEILHIVEGIWNVTNQNLTIREMKRSLRHATNQITRNMDEYLMIIENALSITSLVVDSYKALSYYFEDVYMADDNSTEQSGDFSRDASHLFEIAKEVTNSITVLFLKKGLFIGNDVKILRTNCLDFSKMTVDITLNRMQSFLTGILIVGDFYIESFKRSSTKLKHRSRASLASASTRDIFVKEHEEILKQHKQALDAFFAKNEGNLTMIVTRTVKNKMNP